MAMTSIVLGPVQDVLGFCSPTPARKKRNFETATMHRAANLRAGIAFPRGPIAATWPATVAGSFNFLSFSFRRALQMTVFKPFFIEIADRSFRRTLPAAARHNIAPIIGFAFEGGTVIRYRITSLLPYPEGEAAMTTLARAGWIAISSLLLLAGDAAAQPAKLGCTSEQTAQGSQILHCRTAITIVTENGAKFELKDRNRDGHVDSVELSNKALLIEVPKKPGGNRFDVVTPQAIAAVRGTKWAVDAADGKTAVFVVDGRVSVGRRAGRGGVVLGPGDGVDVEATGELIVKRWPPARVTALMARLGQ